MEDSDNGGHAVDQLEAEPQVYQHAEQRVERRQQGLLLQLRSDLRSDDLDVTDGKPGEIGALLQLAHYSRICHAAQLIDGTQDAAALRVAVGEDGACLLRVALLGSISAGQVQWILLRQKARQPFAAGVIEVQFSGVGCAGLRVMRIQGLHNRSAADIQLRLAGLTLRKTDDHFVGGSRSERLDGGVVNACAIHRRTNPVHVGGLLKLDPQLSATAKIHVERQVMPEEKRQNARHTEDEREGEEIPFLPKPIDFYVPKQFHGSCLLLKPYSAQKFLNLRQPATRARCGIRGTLLLHRLVPAISTAPGRHRPVGGSLNLRSTALRRAACGSSSPRRSRERQRPR